MKFTPYPVQQIAIDDAVAFLTGASRNDKRLYQSPTGTGKSVVELCVQERLAALGSECWIISPREEILDGMMDKLDAPGEDPITKKMCTPIRFRNMLFDGRIKRPDHLLFDEAHHHEAESWQQLTLLTGLAPSAGFTATPYRGSPKSTRQFLDHWGEPREIISFLEAVAEGYIKCPTFETLPLVDDDLITVSGGEFQITSIDGVTMDRLGHMADCCRQWYVNGMWDVPTVFSLPSSATCIRLREELARLGIPSILVTAATPRSERHIAFEATSSRIMALINIDCLAKGTPVLTDSGWRPIEEVTTSDLVWDGVEWVTHDGVISKGFRETIKVSDIQVTKDQKILTDKGWIPAWQIQDNTKPLSGVYLDDGRLLVIGSNNATNVDVPVELSKTSTLQTFVSESRSDVLIVGTKNTQNCENSITSDSDLFQKTSGPSCTPRKVRSAVVTTRRTEITNTTVHEGSGYTMNGELMYSPSSHTLPHFRKMLHPALHMGSTTPSTVSTTMGTTNQGTSNTLLGPSRTITGGRRHLHTGANEPRCLLQLLKPPLNGYLQVESHRKTSPQSTALNQRQSSQSSVVEVFDVVNAGPRQRYQAGRLIVHNCVAEGVDFPFKRWVDLAPTMSPVKWVQRMGRVTRPTGDADPSVICTNRNLSRHAYIMEGAVPNDAVVENTDKFPPSERAHARVLGLEALGRFKPTSAKLASGLTLCIYSLSVPVGTSFVEYCCIVHPTQEPVWATKASNIVDGKRVYGAWARTESPLDLRGFSSQPPKALSPKQKAWWDRAAHCFGIAEKDVTRKNFQILPVLCDLGLRFS